MEINEDVTRVKTLEVTLTSNELEAIILAHLKKEFKARGVDVKGLDKADINVNVPYHDGNTDTRIRVVFPEAIESAARWCKEE
jgi:hypothetical protein